MAQVTALLRRIRELPISVETVDPDRAFDQVLAVARQQQLTEYDAAYVELALRGALPLATLDDKLRQAVGVIVEAGPDLAQRIGQPHLAGNTVIGKGGPVGKWIEGRAHPTCRVIQGISHATLDII